MILTKIPDDPVHVYPTAQVADCVRLSGGARVYKPVLGCWYCAQGICTQVWDGEIVLHGTGEPEQ